MLPPGLKHEMQLGQVWQAGLLPDLESSFFHSRRAAATVPLLLFHATWEAAISTPRPVSRACSGYATGVIFARASMMLSHTWIRKIENSSAATPHGLKLPFP